MFRIYSKNQISEELFTVNLTQEEVSTVMNGDLFKDHKHLDEDNCVIVERTTQMDCPTWDGTELREMTREEKITVMGKEELLQDGEYLQGGEIIKVEKPENLIRAGWDKATHSWIETMTKEELLELRTAKILKYAELEKEKTTLEASRFTLPEEITLITEKMATLEQEIIDIAEQISAL